MSIHTHELKNSLVTESKDNDIFSMFVKYVENIFEFIINALMPF